MSVAWFSDAHLDLATWASRPELCYDSRHAFEYIIDQCLQRSVEAIIAAGDLIDVKKPPAEVVRFLRKQLDRVQQAKIPLYYIQGQHEKSNPPWFSAIHEWPTHLHQQRIQLSDVSVVGLDWTNAAQLEQELAKLPEAEVLVCHQVWDCFMGDLTNPEISTEQLPSCFKLVVTGDYHKTAMYRAGDCRIHSLGATNMRKISESSACVFALSDGLALTHCKIPGRSVLRTNLSLLIRTEPGEVVAFLREQVAEAFAQAKKKKLPVELRKPILHVTASHRHADTVKALEASALASDCFLFVATKAHEADDQEDAELRTVVRQQLRTPHLLDVLPLAVDSKTETYKLAAALLQSTDPSSALQAFKEERGLCS